MYCWREDRCNLGDRTVSCRPDHREGVARLGNGCPVDPSWLPLFGKGERIGVMPPLREAATIASSETA